MKPNPNYPTVKFDLNWNGKLYCNVFTTIRPRNDEKYFVGQKLDVYKEDVFMGDVEVVSIKNFMLADLTEAMALLDTGYCKKETIEILGTIYNGRIENITDQEFSHIILKRIIQDVAHNNQKEEINNYPSLDISA